MVGYTSARTLRFVAIGIVCIAAISMGASTITSTVDTGARGGPVAEEPQQQTGPPGDNEGGGNSSYITGEQGSGVGETIQIERCVEPLDTIPGTAAYFGAVFGVIYLIKRRYNTGAALIGSYALAPIVLTAYFLLTQCIEAGGPGVANETQRAGEGGGGEVLMSPEISPIWFLGLFAVLVIGAAAVVVRASGTQTMEAAESQEEADPEGADAMDLAQAAGAAADRLEEHNADVDNEVYRAWLEMTNLLDVPNPDSATPGEFAEAAVEAGLDRDDVDELTTLFEEVRYGKRDPQKREERAISVFRSIESEYGPDTEADLDMSDTTEGDDGGR